MNDELPQGWAEAALPEIAALNMGQSPPSNTYNTGGHGLPFFQGKAEFGDLYPMAEKYCSAPTKIAEAEDILISVRAPVGPTNLCRERSCIGRGLAAIRPRGEIPTRYLLFYLRSIEAWLATQGTGSTFTAISKSDLEELRVRLAPLTEQRRIVAKLQNLLDRVDACQQRLAKIPKLIKRFRQAVLAAACSGRLTADWREENPIIPKAAARPSPPEDIEIADLPETWSAGTLNDCCTRIIDGNYGADYPKKDEFLTSGIPFFTSAAIGEDGNVIEGEIKFVSPQKHAVLRKAQSTVGDVIFTNRGARVGATAMLLDTRFSVCNIGPQVTRLAANAKVLSPKYLFLWMRAPFFLSVMKERNGGSAMNFLNLFALADQIEARYAKAKAYVDKITPSLLARAFRGKLVPQDPNDEPATELLKRIAGLSPKHNGHEH